jgi:uncharacterized secreted protein with C-terminal beta-propeller domain
MRRLLVLLTVLTVALPLAAADATPRAKALKARLKPFGSCESIVDYARRHRGKEVRTGGPVVAPNPAPATDLGPRGDSAAPPEAAPGSEGDSSGTNVQEAGVDEPDIVKSDGRRIFAVAAGRLNAIDARAATPRLLGSLELPVYGGELLLRGDRVLVLSYAPMPVELPPSRAAQAAPDIAYPVRIATQITEIDVSDPAAMRIVATETVDGSYVSARMNGSTARIVLASSPSAIDYDAPVLAQRARGWIPRATFEDRATGRERTRRVASCRQIRRPRAFSGLDTLVVLTVDMRRGLPAVDVDGLMAGGQTVYASQDRLYVATQRFVPPPESPDQKPPGLTTSIHAFDISDAGSTRYLASGQVGGYVLNQFALSEHDGVLRVASTDSPVWWPGEARAQSESSVTTLRRDGRVLLRLGHVGGLGLGEQIFGVRFVGDAGYVVTFRQTDPLYTIDLSRPAEPRVAGELKILGYSAYLHPIGDDLLLGIGQDATEEGRRLGTQLSVFDVSDLARPARLVQRRIGSTSSSEVEYDHHAFLWWPASKLAVLPVDVYDGRGDPFSGAIGFHVGRSRIDEVGRVTHDAAQYPVPVRRSLVVGDRLFTVSELGVKASSPATFADEAWVPFPAAAGGGGGAEPDPGPKPEPARR